MNKIVLKIIKIYQKTLSPNHGPLFVGTAMQCRFFPSCSQYAYEAIERYGLQKGLMAGFFRILKCNPLSKGGFDPVDAIEQRLNHD